MGHLRTENTQVIPPPAFYCIKGGISFLKTVNTLLSESTEGRTRHKGGRAFARTVRVRVRVS